MDPILKALGTASAQTIGLAIAAGLLLVTVALLPKGDRRLLRQPIIYFAIHLVFRGVQYFVEDSTAFGKMVSFVSLGALLATIGRTAVVLVLDAIATRRLSTAVPKIIHDIVQGIVWFVILLAILRSAGVEPGQILTTSALLTAVIGLSLQETLGNLFAGLAVQLQRPFDVGDWIQFDTEPRHIGKVVEINWRATRLITLDRLELVVPNGLLAKSPLKNFSKPTIVVRRSIYVQVGYETPPSKVQEVILAALEDAPLVLKEPAPTVVSNDFKDSGIEYWVRFFINDFDRRDLADGGVRDRLWYAFQRAGMRVPFPQRQVEMHHVSDESRARDSERKATKRELALEKVDFLQVVSTSQRRQLAERASIRLFTPGEFIVRQGDESAELFIILRGEVAVVLESDKAQKEVTRLSTGKFFGEMALVTGEKRRASVRAATECELLVIDHDAFKTVLDETPAIVEQLSQVLADRQIELDEHAAKTTESERSASSKEQSSMLLQRIRKWFALPK